MIHPIHNWIQNTLSEYLRSESKPKIYKDGAASAICEILCENDVPHTLIITHADEFDLVTIWFEEKGDNFHLEWYEEISIKHLEEEGR